MIVLRYMVISALALSWTSATAVQLTHSQNQNFFKKFEFAMVSDKPGAAVAFRLRPIAAEAEVTGKVCFLGDCFTASPRWQLLATNRDINSKQIMVLIDKEGAWGFRKIHLESDIFKQAGARIAHLRLPASVVKNIEEHASEENQDARLDQKLYATSLDQPWSTQWILPVKGRVLSEFGALRIPPQGAPYSHTGVDFRAAVGTSVRASSDGIVIGTDNEVIDGNVITINHGHGLMTRYMHLSKFKVKVGDVVKAGDIIALSGATGRVEGPHFHWEMRIHGRPVDPLSTRLLLARLSDLE